MTTLEMISLLIMPVGGLLIGAWALYFAKHME
ncbi:hypothetical protein C7374_11178 [Falsochrobactrum ovis]|uniref:Uncharacterized protein n=1 Tax=Falsochrobactrum ovis TaxID=1293442 RepID=A0A364JTH8_9HYPH|nr:hypothetical protein C7374_11178 [Falsochrobactrum ovis]